MAQEEHPVAKKQQNPKTNETTEEWKNYKIGPFEFEAGFVWKNVIFLTSVHIGFVYALLTFNFVNHKMLLLWVLITCQIAKFGVTGGAHRLWTHRSYKANLPLRIILLGCYLMAAQLPVSIWAREHRIHHKYTDTNADPHNSNRGFFYCHVGWMMMKKHPEVYRRRKEIDLSDILDDPVMLFAEKHFSILSSIACFIIPVIIPVYCWNEEWYPTIISQWFIRYPLTLNVTWTVNSLAHMFGSRSYDKSIRPAENPMVSFLAMGEGWHNYHHTFPWDYKAAELGNYGLNLTTMVIDGFAKIGWAYDLKHPSKDLVQRVVENRGDGSHRQWSRREK